MMDTNKKVETTLSYTDKGQGPAIVLVHGYLNSKESWGPFAGELAKSYRVICPDVPGHGKSPVIGDTHSMYAMASQIRKLLEELGIKKCTMIGHSMGGYITMSFAEHFPHMLNAFSLFHSTPYADTEEKKAQREREIQLVKEGKLSQIVNTNIPKAFADSNQKQMKTEAERAKEIALKQPPEGVIALLRGMKERPDASETLKNAELPFMLILGKKDNYIDYKSIYPKITLPGNSAFAALDRSGHMGFIEEPEKSVEVVHKFMTMVTNT